MVTVPFMLFGRRSLVHCIIAKPKSNALAIPGADIFWRVQEGLQSGGVLQKKDFIEEKQ